jgi:hypothetical protein
MRRLSCTRLAVILLLSACTPNGPDPDPALDLSALVPPEAELPGWSRTEGPTEYPPERLFEVLDGGAERFLDHGFRSLVRCRYQLGNNPDVSVQLDVYDMGDELGAFGIFGDSRPAGLTPMPWGAGGFHLDTVAAAYRGRVYVHGEADDDRAELGEALETLVAWVADHADGPTSPPSILDPLPAAGRVPASERYVPSKLLGHAFLPGGVVAEYEAEGSRIEVFFTDLGNIDAATNALSELRGRLARRCQIVELAPAMGDDGFRWNEATLGGGTAVRAGHYLAGSRTGAELETGDAVLSELIATLGAR